MSSTIHCIDLKKDLEEGFEPVEENKDKNRPKPRDFSLKDMCDKQ